MVDKFRLPSGASVRQVKKDAKTLKRELNISHHEALNVAAKQHGSDLDWNKLRLHLKNDDAVATLEFQCNLHLQLTLPRPLGFVIGPTGSGRSAIAAELCVNHLKAGRNVINLISEHSYSTIPGYVGDAMGMISSNVPEFTRKHVEGKQNFTELLALLSPKPGTLIVMEEPQTLDQFDTTSISADCARWRVGFIGVVQSDSAISATKEQVGFIADATALTSNGSVNFAHWTDSKSWQSLALRKSDVPPYLFDIFTVEAPRNATVP